jgi:hypothetical protein
MTGRQQSYLAHLAAQAGEDIPTGLTKAEASQRIAELQQRSGRQVPEWAQQVASELAELGTIAEADRSPAPPTPRRAAEEPHREPITPNQRSYLVHLAKDAGEELPKELTRAEASQLIDELATRLADAEQRRQESRIERLRARQNTPLLPLSLTPPEPNFEPEPADLSPAVPDFEPEPADLSPARANFDPDIQLEEDLGLERSVLRRPRHGRGIGDG